MEASLRRCIYCLEEKPLAAFNGEHVLNQAFDKFEANLVLDCVCIDCNQTFGDSIDRKLARDSPEAVARVKEGVLSPRKYQGEGRRTTTAVRFDDGPLRGAWARYFPLPDGERLGLAPLPQAGFAKGSDGDVAFDWHELHALPTPEEVGNRLKLAVGETYRIMIQGAPLAQAVAALEAKGFRDLPQPTEQAPFTGVARAQMTFIIGSPELRAITKMALCYLAATQGPSVARMPQFNDARRYVVAGVEPSTPLVATIANPWDVRRESDGRRPSGHFMALQSFRGQLVVAQVCLFLKLRYVVYLARGGFALPVNFSAGHFFDRDLHRVTPIPPPPLLPSPPRSSARRRGPARR